MACTPAQYNICINQFSSFKTTITLTGDDGNPITITSWSFTGSIRESFAEPTSSNIFFTMSIDSIPSATITFSLPHYQSALLTSKKYFYDIIATNQSTNPEEVYRLLEGKVSVNLGITPDQ